jgi:hypothetical protein
MLNLNGSLTKAGVQYSTLWSEDFSADAFVSGLNAWLKEGKVEHGIDHVKPFDASAIPEKAKSTAKEIADDFRRKKSIMGVFDEGCMGMYNAMIPDELLFHTGVYKERLSQSALYYATTQVSDEEAQAVFDWYIDKGFTFHFGEDEELPQEETERRWQETTPQWPIMHAVTYGVSRDQMMARHKSNHIQVAYANSAEEADLALYTKAALAAELGLEVSLCGTKADGGSL